MPKNMADYEREFIHEVMIEKYGFGNVTPKDYQKEVLKFMKNKMDPYFMIKNLTTFINESSNDMVQQFNNWDQSLAKDKTLYPIHFFGNMLAESKVPSKKTLSYLKSNMTKDAFVNYCNNVMNDPYPGRKENIIEAKMNSFKKIEAFKPTGNAFTKFFKKLFNIGGYNDKLAAYESCKNSVRELVGNELTDEEFEMHINSDIPFKSTMLHKSEVVKPIIIHDINLDKDEPNIELNIQKEPVKEEIRELGK